MDIPNWTLEIGNPEMWTFQIGHSEVSATPGVVKSIDLNMDWGILGLVEVQPMSHSLAISGVAKSPHTMRGWALQEGRPGLVEVIPKSHFWVISGVDKSRHTIGIGHSKKRRPNPAGSRRASSRVASEIY